MRVGVAFALTAAVLAAAPSRAAEVSNERGLVVVFIHSFEDICLPIVKGDPLPTASAAQLEAVPADAPIRKEFPDISDWRASRAFPDSLFVGSGDKSNTCVVILSNTRRTRDALLGLAKGVAGVGFEGKKISPTQVMYSQEEAYGFLNVTIQVPHDAVNDGKGEQTGYFLTLTQEAKNPNLSVRPPNR